eukprot:TRINITY_DN4487_c0_g1_i10.p1 TRINITY_DN4487_c0_g1~~TRINITY_DN4487_c0_g1_i10.p1  ORF type:complete len:238 (-),score=65.90 TRINITY_DN4487_c0_g1_i10:428-1141(-)
MLTSFQGREIEQMRNWYRGVYLIVMANSEGDGAIHAVNLNRIMSPEQMVRHPAWEVIQEINGAMAASTCSQAGHPVAGLIKVCHSIGGPCAPGVGFAMAVLRSPEQLTEFLGPQGAGDGVQPVLVEEDGVLIYGPTHKVMEHVKKEAQAGLNVVMLVYWGLAGWTKTQLLGELARGSWGMCKGSLQDATFVSPADMSGVTEGVDLWAAVSNAERPIFAPDNEMQSPSWGQEESLETH